MNMIDYKSNSMQCFVFDVYVFKTVHFFAGLKHVSYRIFQMFGVPCTQSLAKVTRKTQCI